MQLELSKEEMMQRNYRSKLAFVDANLGKLQDLALMVQSAVRGELPDAQIVEATDTVSSEVETIQQWIATYSTN